MTLRELKQKVAESENKEWFQSYTLKLSYPHANFTFNLKGAVNIYEFILKQIEAFAKYPTLPPELSSSNKRLIAVRDNIIHLIDKNEIIPGSWSNNLADLTNHSRPIFLPEFPETEFLINIFNERNKYYPGAYEYFTGSLQHYTNKDYFTGYMLAYEFLSKDFSSLVERKEAEKRSILNTRADFQKKLGEAEKEVVEYISLSNQKFEEYASKVDTLKTQKEEDFTSWFKKARADFKNFDTDSNTKIKDLENLYIEKLKLEAPAQYWNKRAAKLRNEGRNWLIGMIVNLAIAVITLVCILQMIADGTMQKIFSETSTAIKWSVAFITLISFLAYGIRTFAKLTFSSFHLVRDAEEREQLTYVYLALKKEKNIDETERHLIMQSLFSRADSGLLKDDSGPTMPGNIIDQVAKR